MLAMCQIRWSLLLLLLSLSAPSLHAELACNTHWNRLRIGMVGGLPFTADVELTDRTIPPDESPKHLSDPTFNVHIARDATGKVSIRMRWASPKAQNSSWDVTICDPSDQTTTYVHGITVMIVKNDVCGIVPGLMHYRGSAFQAPLLHSKIPIDDLGTKDLYGVRVHGFRWSFADRIFEQWLSEDMAIEMSHTETASQNQSETLAAVTSFQRGEPSPEIFQIPNNLKDTAITRDGCLKTPLSPTTPTTSRAP